MEAPCGNGDSSPRRPETVPWIALVVPCLLLVMTGQGRASAEWHGRFNTAYQQQSGTGATTRQVRTNLEVTALDELLVKNRLLLDLYLDRYDDLELSRQLSRHRLRLGLSGTAYDLSLLLSPRQTVSLAADSLRQEADDIQLSWTYNPTRWPRLRAGYHRHRLFAAPGSAEVSQRSTDVTLEAFQDLGAVRLSALHRRLDDEQLATGRRHRTRQWLGRASLDRDLGHGVRVSAGTDLQEMRTEGTGGADSRNRTRNLRGSLSWRASSRLQVGLDLLDRRVDDPAAGDDDSLAVRQRTLQMRVHYRYASWARTEIRRDYRFLAGPAGETTTDYLRLQTSLEGRLRQGARARFSMANNIVLTAEGREAPADVYDLNIDQRFYRRTTLRTQLSVTRYRGRGGTELGRFTTIGLLELRSWLTRRMELQTTFRSSRTADTIGPWDADQHSFYTGVTYNRGPYSWVGNWRWSRNRRPTSSTTSSLSTALTARLRSSLVLSANLSHQENTGQVASSGADTYNIQLQWQIQQGTSFFVSAQRTSRTDGETNRAVNVSFLTTF